MTTKYKELIGPYEMHPSDMKYVEKILKLAKIKVKNIGRETKEDSDKQLLVLEKDYNKALYIFENLKYKLKTDIKFVKKYMRKH